MNPTPSNCCGGCPTADELRSLLGGNLSDERQQECVAHLDECCSCQQAIEETATGDATFPELVEHIDQRQPGKQSAYWSAVSSIERELATTFIPEVSRAQSRLNLNFLGPPSDPAYL